MTTNILIVGVGGQGTLLASRVLGAYAVIKGLDCKLSEVHGMSQRGGSVVTHIRIGESVQSPLVSEGKADYILAFERLEGIRWSHYLKEGGTMLINDQIILPMPVITGAQSYPKDIFDRLTAEQKSYKIIDGLRLAGEAGNTKAVNVVLLGVLFKLMGESLDIALKAIEASVPAKLLDINIKALQLGYQAN